MKQPLLPTLFDRLRDDAPSTPDEPALAYVVSASGLRDILRRDLAFLLNTTNADDLIDRRRHHAAATSSLNFGMPPLAGMHVSDRRWADIERTIRRAIADHEPRLVPGTVSVSPMPLARGTHAGHVLQFEIRAAIDARPYPLSLTVQSSVDLESRRVRIGHASVVAAAPDAVS